MKRGIIISSFLVGVLIIFLGLASAGITGHDISQDTDVSVTVEGTTAVTVGPIDNSSFGSGLVLTENTDTTTPEFFVKVCDADGVNDINDSSVQVIMQKTGDTSRTNTSCVLVGDLDSTCANYSCTVDMWYWDGEGTWTINASAEDLGNTSRIYNSTYTFKVGLLRAMVISHAQINWTGISPSQTNATADNDPTIINNTGNYNGTINITGLDLYGLTLTTEIFGVDNFTTDLTDGNCGTGDSVYLINSTQVEVPNSIANRGNLSLGSGSGQEDFYYCIPTVPLLSTQQYSTDNLGSWTIYYN